MATAPALSTPNPRAAVPTGTVARRHARAAALGSIDGLGWGWLASLRSGWTRRLHRALAVLVACSLALFQAESLIADVCDGDATPAERVALARPLSDLPVGADEASATQHGEAAGNDVVRSAARLASRGARSRVDVVSAAPTSPEQSGGAVPVHAVHTCHCVHTHAGVLPRLDAVYVTVVATTTGVPALRSLAPPSVTRQPRLRPPLA